MNPMRMLDPDRGEDWSRRVNCTKSIVGGGKQQSCSCNRGVERHACAGSNRLCHEWGKAQI